MTFNCMKRWAACALLAWLSLGSAAWAQTKVTRLLVAFPPGGPVDFIALTISEQLCKELGQQVVV